MSAIDEMLDEYVDLELEDIQENEMLITSLVEQTVMTLIEDLNSKGIDSQILLLAIAEKLHEQSLILAYPNSDMVDNSVDAWVYELFLNPEIINLSSKIH